MRKLVTFFLLSLLLGALVITPKEAKAEESPYWAKVYRGLEVDRAYAVGIASNGDVIVVGVTNYLGGVDIWVLRLDENGNVKWQKTFGGSESKNDEAYTIAIAENGDIIVAGFTASFGDVWGDVWVLRLDENGNVKWQKTYGGEWSDVAYAVDIANNGDIIVAGWTESFGAGGKDVWVLRLDKNGNVKWQKTYGGSSWNRAYAIAIAPNGDIIVATHYLLRLGPDGELKWAIELGGPNTEPDIKVLPEKTGILVGVWYDLIARFNVDEVPNYSGWEAWNEVSIGVHESDAVVQTTNAIVKTSNAVVSNTNAEVQNTNAEVETLWTYTPSSALRIYGHDVNIQEKVSEEQAEETVENETAVVTYQAITEVYNVTVKVDGEEKPGYLVRHNVTIIDVEGEVEAFRTVFNVSKEVAYSVDDMILPPDAIIINPEPVIALDIKDPKEGQTVNQTIIVLTEAPESEFMQGVKIDHEVITKSNNSENSTCGPIAFLGFTLIPAILRRKK
ncbi:hypothetical protein NF865_09305 [Thermococcus aggregans]|uniref:Uncharacterized protein n=1 Tax=Thermococcus aggregans TaxID=110163 RepID=A0A9E7MX20_THEAG|nr:hypothetical protein [Thermococcus aggregans]USS40484.1 hypothetical protein NF865_09305 [Thermococcus aggregans]